MRSAGLSELKGVFHILKMQPPSQVMGAETRVLAKPEAQAVIRQVGALSATAGGRVVTQAITKAAAGLVVMVVAALIPRNHLGLVGILTLAERVPEVITRLLTELALGAGLV